VTIEHHTLDLVKLSQILGEYMKCLGLGEPQVKIGNKGIELEMEVLKEEVVECSEVKAWAENEINKNALEM
jgi:hypothetical protein